jgi:chitinase
MKKLSLLAVSMILIFCAGFIAGIFYPYQSQLTPDRIQNSGSAPQSEKNPDRKSNPKADSQKSKVLIGYVQDYRDPAKTNYKNFTHIIFSFGHPTTDGKLLFNGDLAMNNLRKTVSMAKQHDTKVLLAIGGWFHLNGGESYPYFKAAITNPASRKKLVNELARIADREKLDGIDLDFEHPRTSEDARSLAEFAKDLSNALHPKGKELSIAVNGKVHSVTGTEIHSVVFDPSMFQYFDHVNLMAYDGQWDGDYNAANLSPYSYSANIIDYWIRLFDQHGFERDKLVLGVPLYAQPEDPAIKQVSYEAIIENNKANVNRDTVQMNNTTYHYNGHATLQKKTALALENQLGGMMLWEAGLDAAGPGSAAGAISKALYAPEKNRYYTRN